MIVELFTLGWIWLWAASGPTAVEEPIYGDELVAEARRAIPLIDQIANLLPTHVILAPEYPTYDPALAIRGLLYQRYIIGLNIRLVMKEGKPVGFQDWKFRVTEVHKVPKDRHLLIANDWYFSRGEVMAVIESGDWKELGVPFKQNSPVPFLEQNYTY